MSIHMSPTVGELAKALAAAQAELEPAKRDATNPHFRSKYADLSACWDAVRAPLARHGLAVSQLPSLDGDVVRLTTMLLHTSGEFIGSDAAVRIAKHDAPSVGSALTYLRRYSLSAIVGLSTEDDDGASAMASAPAQQSRSQPVAQPSQELRAAAAQVDRAFPAAQTTYAPIQQADGSPSCPQCGGGMWDNRGTPSKPKTNPKAPDYKCKDKSCDGVIWPPRGPRKQERMEAAPMPEGPPPDLDEMPF
jgi:hypothetical protein